MLETGMVAGREYKFYEPDGSSNVVLAGLHGMGSSAEEFFGDAKLKAVADQLGWTIVLPEGKRGQWGGRDLAYIHAAIQAMKASGDKVYVCGHSAGSGMAVRLAFDYNGEYPAICCVNSGKAHGLITKFKEQGMPHRVSVLKVNSLHDNTVKYDDALRFSRLIAMANGLGQFPHDEYTPGKDPLVKIEKWSGANVECEFVTLGWERTNFDGPVHTWPSKSRGSGYEMTQEMIDFLQRH